MRIPPRVEILDSRIAPSVNVLTFHNDLASTGLNPNETQLTPARLRGGSFGRLFTTGLDGQVYAQPLVGTGITIANGPNTIPGAAGEHDAAFVATEHDSLYAVDASATGGSILWERSFLDISNPSNNPYFATAITAVPSADTNSADISPEIGITGTPVIDLAAGSLYVVVKTKETILGQTFYVQRLHAVAISDGTDRVAPYLIGFTSNGNANNTNIYVYGNGDGSVVDPYANTGRPVVQFNALRENQRGALSLVNNTLYAEWASHGDNGPYHGWVVAWDVTNLQSPGWRLTGVLNTSPNGGLAGIWQGSGRLAFEADGSAFYFATGNGPPNHGNPTLSASGFPIDGNYYEALVKVVADPATTPANQNINGWGLRVADYFIPFNQLALDNADTDFGSGAPMILPDSAGIPGHPHLMVVSGKEGKIYLVDRDNLGRFDTNGDHVLNAVPDGSGHLTPPVQIAGSLSTPAYYDGNLYFVSGYSGSARAFTINTNGTLSITSQTAISNFGYLPGSPDISANGQLGGIAWVMDRNLNEIHAYDAATFTTELWNSGQRAGGSDNLGTVVKFAVPTVANGEVFVGTTNSLVGYGVTTTLPGNLSALANVVTHSAEYAVDTVTAAYEHLLGRAPDTVGLSEWTIALQQGMSDERMEAGFVSSPEYLANHGGVGRPWLVGLYQDILGRTASGAELNSWIAALASGASTGDVAYDFTASVEREGLTVASNYLTFLGRAATQSEINAWTNALVGGMNKEVVSALFLGSAEYYFSPQRGNANNADWVRSLYHDVLQRAPLDSELIAWEMAIE